MGQLSNFGESLLLRGGIVYTQQRSDTLTVFINGGLPNLQLMIYTNIRFHPKDKLFLIVLPRKPIIQNIRPTKYKYKYKYKIRNINTETTKY